MKREDENGGDLVRETLEAVARDETAPQSARVQAARTLAELDGRLGASRDPSGGARKSPGEMSLAEIDAELERLGSA
jgi:hypothetical protein